MASELRCDILVHVIMGFGQLMRANKFSSEARNALAAQGCVHFLCPRVQGVRPIYQDCIGYIVPSVRYDLPPEQLRPFCVAIGKDHYIKLALLYALNQVLPVHILVLQPAAAVLEIVPQAAGNVQSSLG